jgi:predicted nuclease of restriction endonuclease-like (RecB) superfamily
MEYLHYVLEGAWDTRTLQRNITKRNICRAMVPDTKKKPTPQTQIKDPYILEFLGMAGNTTFTERKLETELINHL